VQIGENRPGGGDIAFQYVGFVNENIGAAGSESLIADHIFGRHANADLVEVRHRLGRVVDGFIEGHVACRVAEWLRGKSLVSRR